MSALRTKQVIPLPFLFLTAVKLSIRVTQGALAQPRVVGEGLLFSRYCPCDMGFGWRATLLMVPLSHISVFILNIHSSRGVLAEMGNGTSCPDGYIGCLQAGKNSKAPWVEIHQQERGSQACRTISRGMGGQFWSPSVLGPW